MVKTDSDFSDLIAGVSDSWLYDYIGVAPATFRRWKTGKARVPIAVHKLLSVRLGGFDALAGPAWKGYRIGADGLFYHPFWKRGFTPGELRGLFFQVQRTWLLEREKMALERELTAARALAQKPAELEYPRLTA